MVIVEASGGPPSAGTNGAAAKGGGKLQAAGKKRKGRPGKDEEFGITRYGLHHDHTPLHLFWEWSHVVHVCHQDRQFYLRTGASRTNSTVACFELTANGTCWRGVSIDTG